MNVRDFAAIIIRLFGLWLLFQCVFLIEQTIAVKFMVTMDVQGQAYNRFVFFAHILNDLEYFVVGIILVWKPYLVADRVSPQRTLEGHIRLTTTNLMLLCFSVAGLVFTVNGVRNLIGSVGEYLFAPEYIVRGARDKAAILSNAFQTIAGLWLLFGFRQIVRGLRKAWQAGRGLGMEHRPLADEDKESSSGTTVRK